MPKTTNVPLGSLESRGSPLRAHPGGAGEHSTCNRDHVCPDGVSQGRCIVSATREGCVSPLNLEHPLGRDRVSQTGLSTKQVSLCPIRFPRAGLPAQPGTSPKQNCPPFGWKRPGAGALSPLSDWRPPHGGAEAALSGFPQTKSHQTLFWVSLASCLPFSWDSRVLASDSPTNGKGRGINMGLPWAGPRLFSPPAEMNVCPWEG